LNRVRAIILDFDGVVLESNELKTAAFAAVFARFPEHEAEMMAFHHAHVSASRYDKFRHLVTDKLGKPANDPLVDDLAAAFSQEMRGRLDACAWVPGAESFVRRVAKSVPAYVASMTPQQELEAALARRGIADLFTGVYGCPPWAKDRALADIVDQLGGAHGVVFVGDSAGDQRAARTTGVEFLARDSGLPFDDPTPSLYPDLTAVAAAVVDRLP
jgi:phosphoglycolate phosphatase-like HAD superfamily hydrolase